ncbi:MAG: hydroxymethylbilane synthase [Thermoleophilaceae bacterium]|nr:hydroxymethylbilane synthase [Thermoleophilaceae bacterium]
MAIRLGSRGSPLAVAQAAYVRERLERLGEEVEVITIRTSGDERPGGAPAPENDDKARFVKEIEEALLREEIDLAVHSAKDVPSLLPDGLAIVGVPQRADARDTLCGPGSLDALADGAVVGTASLRRRAQLLAARPDLDVREARGNVDTRLRRLAEGSYDALVLAAAGLSRLGREEGEPISEEDMTPAPGQGCLALEARTGDAVATDLAGRLTDRAALVALTAERALVEGLAATCRTPVGAHARLRGDDLVLDAFAGMPDGSEWIRDRAAGDAGDPAALGRAVAERMLAAGARELLDAAERAD